MTALNVTEAARLYIARRDRLAHPDGRTDSACRWYPSEAETCECCSSIRYPSRRWPWSYMVHCRTMRHVAELCGVPYDELRDEVLRIETAQEEVVDA